ncbi:acyl carrier protein [Streptomyces sp. NRRL B-1347]|uniref:acyl carrier protein n=1 Tax=Streptomyces sp. NRRL B-1347 TaxID=1476877 RepID=UPI0004C5EC86|nr:acyl carrier protein [Streptomyces sp. NRRL B-1347]
MSTIEERVKRIIVEQLNVKPEEVTNDASFEELGADSLDLVELGTALEFEFSTDIPDEDAERITTVQVLIDWMKAHAR